MSLKTLEDINSTYVATAWIDGKFYPSFVGINKEELIKEALGWAKHYDRVLGENNHESNWIKKFFNLTKENKKQ